MRKYRQHLPQLDGDFFLTDGGLETTLIFCEQLELPHFAAFHLLRTDSGREALCRYFRSYAILAEKYGVSFVLESATWRASADWGRRLFYSDEGLADANRKAIELCREIRDEFEFGNVNMVISGCLGPRGDGYSANTLMNEAEAEQYHRAQVETLCDTDADMITALTITYPEEAIGITRVARAAGLPVVISFTVETDGRLPCGKSLQDAIRQVDRATRNGPAYYMINCAHPAHFQGALAPDEQWTSRIRGLRANASTKSHAELDASEELDDGDPQELARQYRDLKNKFPHWSVFGGCCGTDTRHVEAICRVCAH